MPTTSLPLTTPTRAPTTQQLPYTPSQASRYAMIQQLLRGGVDTSPVYSKGAGWTRVLQAVVGGLLDRELSNEQEQRLQRYNETLSRGINASQPWKPPEDVYRQADIQGLGGMGSVRQAPTVAPGAVPVARAGEAAPGTGGSEAMYKVLSSNPDTLPLAAQLQFSEIQRRQALADALTKAQGLENIKMRGTLSPEFQGEVAAAKRAPLDYVAAEAAAKRAPLDYVRDKASAEAAGKLAGGGTTSMLTPEQAREQGLTGVDRGGTYQRDPSGKITPVDKPLSPRDQAFDNLPPDDKAKVLSKSLVTVNSGDKGLTKLSEGQAKYLLEQRQGAMDAIKSLGAINEARLLLDQGITSGPGAEFVTKVDSFLRERLGWNAFNTPIENTQAYLASMATQTAVLIKQFGAGSGLSDADREYAKQAAAGDIAFSEGALRKILDINEKIARAGITQYQDLSSQVMSRPGSEDLLFNMQINPADVPGKYEAYKAPTDEQLDFTAKKYNMTKEEVLQRHRQKWLEEKLRAQQQ